MGQEDEGSKHRRKRVVRLQWAKLSHRQLETEMTSYPDDFSPQIGGLDRFKNLIEKNPKEIVEYLRMRPKECEMVLGLSYDKRCTPSTFVEEIEGRYRVGWYSNGYKALHMHDHLAEAIADFLLFSFGKPRLTTD